MIKRRNHKDGTTSYEIRVSMGRDLNGKQIFKYCTWKPSSGMTKRQIDKELERQKVLFEEKCRNGQVLDTSTKFADFAEQWLDVNRDNHSPAYQESAKCLLVRINAGIGHIRIDKIQPHHLQMFYKNLSEDGVKKSSGSAIAIDTDYLSNIIRASRLTKEVLAKSAGLSSTTISTAFQGKRVSLESAQKISNALCKDIKSLFNVTEHKEPLSAKTILHHHRLISAILETAVKWQVIYDNPARRVEPPKVKKKEAVYLDDKQAIEVIEALENTPIKWRTAVMLLIYSGMRRGELCGLLWTDIDFDNGIINISKANQYLSSKGIFEKGTKNTSSERVIRLPDDMFTLLKQYRAWQAQERLKAGDRWEDSGKVFTQGNGLPIHPDSITGWVKKFTEENNLPKFSPHSLRHTNATLLIMSGIPVKAVSARLGHADQNVTNAVYSHAIQTADALASDVVGEILKPKKSKSEKA